MIDEQSKLRAIWEHTDSSYKLKLREDDIHVISSYAKVDHNSAHELMDQYIEKNGGFAPGISIEINTDKANKSGNDNAKVKKFTRDVFFGLLLLAMNVFAISCAAVFVYEKITN